MRSCKSWGELMLVCLVKDKKEESLVIGYWSLVIGHWLLVIGYWSLVISY